MLKESFLKYLRYERNYSEHTVVAYGRDLADFEAYFKEQDADFDFLKVDSDMVRSWVVSLMDKHYQSTSVNRKLSALRSFYHFLLWKGQVRVNPTLKVVGPKKRKPLPVFVREEDMNRLLDGDMYEDSYCGVRDRTILEVFYSTGIRLSELTGMTVADVDLLANVIRVTGKRDKQRIVPFGEPLKKVLEAYLEVRNALPTVQTEALFLGSRGKPIGREVVYGLVREYLSKVVRLKKRSPHVLRHSFATAMLNNGAELEAVKELLGHERLSTTQIYTHTTFEELKQVYKQAHPRA